MMTVQSPWRPIKTRLQASNQASRDKEDQEDTQGFLGILTGHHQKPTSQTRKKREKKKAAVGVSTEDVV